MGEHHQILFPRPFDTGVIVALSGIMIAIGTIVDMDIVICENILRRLGVASDGQRRDVGAARSHQPKPLADSKEGRHQEVPFRGGTPEVAPG